MFDQLKFQLKIYSGHAVTFLIPPLGSCILPCGYRLGVRREVPLFFAMGGSDVKTATHKGTVSSPWAEDDTF